MNESIQINKEVLVSLQHQMLLYMTIVANLSQLEQLKGTIDLVTKMFVEQVDREEAEKIVNVILTAPDEYIKNWNNSIEELRKYNSQGSQSETEAHESEVTPIIKE